MRREKRVQSYIPVAQISDGRLSLAKKEKHFAIKMGTERYKAAQMSDSKLSLL